ncbi:hypothetical protein HUU53_00880 [Candidatus Micrarchaeota archaeon]|nr:hypothetical protein [Candidatus Micrarchaeota archaeon]
MLFLVLTSAELIEPSSLLQPNNGYSEFLLQVPSEKGEYFFKADFHSKEGNCGGPGSSCASVRCVNQSVFVNSLQQDSFLTCEPNPASFCGIKENYHSINLTQYSGTQVSVGVSSVGVSGCQNGWGGWQRFLQLEFIPKPNAIPTKPVFNNASYDRVYGNQFFQWTPSIDEDGDALEYEFFLKDWEEASCCSVTKNVSLLEDGAHSVKIRSFDGLNYSQEDYLELIIDSSFTPEYSLTQQNQEFDKITWLLSVSGRGEGVCSFVFVGEWFCDLKQKQEKQFTTSLELTEFVNYESNFIEKTLVVKNPSFLNYSSLVFNACSDYCLQQTIDLNAFQENFLTFKFEKPSSTFASTPSPTVLEIKQHNNASIESISEPVVEVVEPVIASVIPSFKPVKLDSESSMIVNDSRSDSSFLLLFPVIALVVGYFFTRTPFKKQGDVLVFKEKPGKKLYCLLNQDCEHNGESIETILGLLVVFDCKAILYCSESNVREFFYSEKSLNELIALRISHA